MEFPGSAGDGDSVDLTLSLAVGGSAAKTAKARSADGSGDRRRKRKRKQAEDRLGDVVFGSADVAAAEDMAALPAKMLQTRARDRTVREGAAAAFSGHLCKLKRVVDGDKDKTRPRVSPSPNPSSRANPFGNLPLPVMYPCHQAQYVAMPSGYGVACMMPCWGPAMPAVADGLHRIEGNVYRMVAASVTSSCPSNACSNASKGMESIEVDNTGSNSSEISSHRSEPILGGSNSSSSDSKSNSNSSARNAGEVKKPEAPLPEQGTNRFVPGAGQSRSSISKPPDSLKKISSALLRMPRVSTTGDGPNGRTINGFLHTIGKSEVRIVCGCHGSSFTPAEFVKHAGGTNVSQALRQIVMVRC